jgi:triacylglycerol esterase/lipase EstA (alpha/beta hydrolase family)
LICRDGYFSTLKINIEAMARREKKKVVVLGHSMGNRIIQYFLNWVRTINQSLVGQHLLNQSIKLPGWTTQAKLNHGQAWIDQNIHTFVAVGAPFLGAPKSVRGLVRAIISIYRYVQ